MTAYGNFVLQLGGQFTEKSVFAERALSVKVMGLIRYF
jgi:hypothetical protein